jgi:uncharacterized protein (TIGR00255 family)
MIKSMTGFGKALSELPNKKIHIEIRALNSKHLDISTKLPYIYKEKELEIRKLLGKYLIRGKIDVSLFVEVLEEENVPVINKSVVANYYNQLKTIARELDIDQDEQLLRTIMRLPDVMTSERKELTEKEWQAVREALENASLEINKFRDQEGASLAADMIHQINVILELLQEVGKYEKTRVEKVEERIRENLETKTKAEDYDQNRFEQELIYYLEKLDISEEKVRLKNHCTYFLQTLKEAESVGKKLGFIAQEIGREINTLGSKANDINIQKRVVLMKDALEKIKEQVLNVL